MVGLRTKDVGPAVHELQELDGELDVAQAAATELELTVGLLGRHVLLDAPTHRLDVLDEVRGDRRRSQICGSHRVDEGRAQREVAGRPAAP